MGHHHKILPAILANTCGAKQVLFEQYLLKKRLLCAAGNRSTPRAYAATVLTRRQNALHAYPDFLKFVIPNLGDDNRQDPADNRNNPIRLRREYGHEKGIG
jgi:hypothetical protein